MVVLNVYMAVFIFCMNHSFTSPGLCLYGEIKLSNDLKGFSFIITFFRVFWRHTVRQYFYVESMDCPRPGSRKYSSLHIHKCSQRFKMSLSDSVVKSSRSQRCTQSLLMLLELEWSVRIWKSRIHTRHMAKRTEPKEGPK